MAKSKRTNQVNLSGELDFESGTVTEYDKEDINTYSWFNELKAFDGKEIAITIKEQDPLKPIEE